MDIQGHWDNTNIVGQQVDNLEAEVDLGEGKGVWESGNELAQEVQFRTCCRSKYIS